MSAIYEFGRFELRTAARELLVDGEPVPLGARAYDVLVALIQRRERVVAKKELLDLVWPGLVVEENNLQVQVSALRKILGQGAIATIPGQGYRFTLAAAEDGEADARHAVGRLQRPLAPLDEDAPSIAVLPFVNMSDDQANEYFADGVAEELLNVLSKIRGLRVASHTSAFSFKGRQADIATVAAKLNVSAVLEGSVRKAGKRVRITVQLVEAATDSNLWSDTYDREVEDIFAVQDDIARSVVEQLRSTLLGEPQDASTSASANAEVRDAVKGRRSNAEAYRLYLLGKSLVGRRAQAAVATGIEHLRQAVNLDPAYASAWATLSHALMIEAGTGGWKPFVEGYANARKAARRALTLEPHLAEAHMALGHVLMSHDWDRKGAEAATRRALELAPGNADVVLDAAMVTGNLGNRDESIALCRRAIALDPLNPRAHRYLGFHSRIAGLLDEAERAVMEALALDPFGGLTHSALGDVYLAQGRGAEALAAFERESHEGFRLKGLSVAHHALEQKDRSAAALAQLADLPMHAYLNAQANAYCGNVDTAFGWLDRAYAQRNAGLAHLAIDPFLNALHRDPRWELFLDKMGWPGDG